MIVVIVQARTGSTRLPQKVLRPILGRPLLSYTFERLKALSTKVTLVLATTTKEEDDLLIPCAQSYGVKTFRGSEEHVLSRFYLAAKQCQAKVVVRVTGDCPLVQPKLLDQMLSFFMHSDYDYLSNVLERSYPKGLDLEIFTFDALEKAYLNATTEYQIEHVTPYLYQNPEKFSLYNFKIKEDLSKINLSVDTLEDFYRIQNMIEALYPKNRLFELDTIKEHLLLMQ